MKTTATFCFIIIYTIALSKPVLPLLKDAMAHIFWKAEHVATVHHHHGHHHVEEEIAEAAHEEENDKYPTATKTSEPVSVHIVFYTIYNAPHLITKKQTFVISDSKISPICLDKHYPPPKAC